MKDPAFLFYYQDFLVGTNFMTMEERGIYITILCHMADKGRLSKEHMLNICQSYVFTKNMQNKFKLDDEGYYYNERLTIEIEKRRKYAESRRNNRNSQKHMSNICSTYVRHMENENKDENIVRNIEGGCRGGTNFDSMYLSTFPDSELPAWQEWIQYKLENGKYSKTSAYSDLNLLKEAIISKITITDLIKTAIQNHHAGLRYSLKELKGQNGFNKHITEDKLRGISEDISKRFGQQNNNI